MTPTAPSTPPRSGISRRTAVMWFAIGVTVAFAMQWVQAQSLGGEWNALLSTWDEGPLRPVIERELGPVTTIDLGGHDGQVSYVVALDPLGNDHANLRDDAGLRWRRILYPLVSGLAGTLRGHALLVSLTVVAAFGFGLATAAWADLVACAGLRRWSVVGVLGNPGAILGVILLTPDALALGLSLLAISLFVRRRLGWAAAILVLVALTKDQYLLVALSLGAFAVLAGRRREGALVIAPAVAALGVWSLFVAATIGGVTETNEALALPFVGVADGIAGFGSLPPDEQVELILAYAMVLVAVVATMRTRFRLVRHLAVPWLLVAPLLSRWVWQTGNNSLRVLTPLWFVAVVGVEEWLARSFGSAPASPSEIQ